jgi:hypothetical protein
MQLHVDEVNVYLLPHDSLYSVNGLKDINREFQFLVAASISRPGAR